MGKNSAIAWTHHTFNPWRGCVKVSAGCTNCYAETMSHRNPAVLGEWGLNGKRAFAAESYWHQPFAWDAAAEKAGERHRVFCASLADVFEDRRDLDAQRDRLHALIALTPHLDWLLLTKRPEVAREYYEQPDLYPRVLRAADAFRAAARPRSRARLNGFPVSNPALRSFNRNRWIGVSVEDEQRAEERIPALLAVPAAIRFVSYEPALGPVDFSAWLPDVCLRSRTGPDWKRANALDWVIVGGESGHGARPFDLEWARSVIRQCSRRAAVFVKQLGARPLSWNGWLRMADPKGGDPEEWPADLRVQAFPVP